MSEASDYDSPWKEAWRIYLHSFMRLCFGQVETAIDWRRPPEFLDKELQKLTRQSESGKQFVDMLIKVWLLNGSAEWILLHVEVQHRPDPEFETRLYRYNYRAMDVYGKPVGTLAVLADMDPHWRPNHYEMAVPGTRGGSELGIFRIGIDEMRADLAAKSQILGGLGLSSSGFILRRQFLRHLFQ